MYENPEGKSLSVFSAGQGSAKALRSLSDY